MCPVTPGGAVSVRCRRGRQPMYIYLRITEVRVNMHPIISYFNHIQTKSQTCYPSMTTVSNLQRG